MTGEKEKYIDKILYEENIHIYDIPFDVRTSCQTLYCTAFTAARGRKFPYTETALISNTILNDIVKLESENKLKESLALKELYESCFYYMENTNVWEMLENVRKHKMCEGYKLFGVNNRFNEIREKAGFLHSNKKKAGKRE